MSERETIPNWAAMELEMLRTRLAKLEKGVEEYACTGSDEPCGCYNLITKDRGYVAELEAALREAIGHLGMAGCPGPADRLGKVLAKGRAQG